MQMTHLSPSTWSVRLALGNALFHRAIPDRFPGLLRVYTCRFPLHHVKGRGKPVWGASGHEVDATEWGRLPPT